MDRVSEGKKAFLGGVATLAAAFLIGTMAMIYNNDKNSQLFAKELAHLTQQIADLKTQVVSLQIKVEANTLDRWTRSQHDEYDKALQGRFIHIEKRLFILEQSRRK